ncbi:uncharacterized protein J4E84_003247 [Alternaria hordeiaustralica]|uniref:uncharacterized protein n=1 Tax=Alternaria hordeiaustralica TaxID=1187925 RepID=UPI0020C2A88A|nr:uncharacterized protein J4E84_003247 [Alternaria hordeiaustralica]KAI4692278.1 hypothetical protein J4E84_003247 [Alternaria hordeiaustralica]
MSQPSSLLPPWASREYWFPSEGERDHFASQYGEFIIKMLKSENWDEFDSRDSVVRMAKAYIKEMYEDPYYDVPAPRVYDPATLTEAHFVFWAHTSSGRQEVEEWRDLRGIVYKAFAAPRFLREILTRGTRLHSEWSSGGVRLTAAQDLATIMLRSETVVFTERDISACIWRRGSRFYERQDKINEYVFKVQHKIDEYVLKVQDNFDQDFPVTGMDFCGETQFTMRPGQENKIFAPWYDLGQIGYHDIPDWPANSNIASRLMTDLPAELMLIVLENLFKFDQDIHIVFDHDVDEYIFIVEREQHLKEFPHGLQGVQMPMGNFWKLPYCHEFFAFGATGEANRAMMMGVFHRNKFIVHDD